MGYKFSFSETLELRSEIAEKQNKLEWLKEKEKELPVLEQKMREYQKAYSGPDSISVRDKLTAYISEYSEKNNCLVTEIPLKTSYRNDGMKIQTNTFTIKGNFKELLVLLNSLEAKFKFNARIMSAKFHTLVDVQQKRKNLFLTIVTQSFQQKSS
ncbi:MAG: hypothetical protein ACK50A_08680 [Sphingobacteriaceae bacterium]